jgi:hypothetical protein
MVWTFGGSEALAKILGVERLTPEIVAIVGDFFGKEYRTQCSSCNGGRAYMIKKRI